MPTPVDVLTIRIRFAPGPGEPPVEEWTLSVEPDELQVDEQGLDAALVEVVEQAGQQTTFQRARTFSSGGWGATGLTVIEVLVTLGLGAASNAMYDALVALYQRFAGRKPTAVQSKLPLPESMPPSPDPKTRKRSPARVKRRVKRRKGARSC